MSLPRFAAKSWNGRHLKIRRVTPEERAGIVQDAIAKKVLQNVTSLGFEPGHELKDWREAESEILHPLNCGFLVLDNSVEVNTGCGKFWRGRNPDLRRAAKSNDLRKGPHQQPGNSLQICQSISYSHS